MGLLNWSNRIRKIMGTPVTVKGDPKALLWIVDGGEGGHMGNAKMPALTVTIRCVSTGERRHARLDEIKQLSFRDIAKRYAMIDEKMALADQIQNEIRYVRARQAERRKGFINQQKTGGIRWPNRRSNSR